MFDREQVRLRRFEEESDERERVALAKEFGVPFFETSAKSGLRVEEAFSAISEKMRRGEQDE